MPLSVEHPIAYYGALSAAMSACLYLFASTARNLETMKKRTERRLSCVERETAAMEPRMGTIGTQVDELGGRMKEIEDTAGGLSAVRRGQSMSPGVDANQRTQVMRLARRGERVERIAAELRVPRNEVDLLLKVQRAVAQAR